MQSLHEDVDHRILVPARGEASPRQPGKSREHDVVANGQVRNDPLDLAVLRKHHDARSDSRRNRAAANGLSVDRDRSAVELHDPGHRLERLGAARSEKPPEPDDLAGTDLDVDTVDLVLPTQVCRDQHRRRIARVGRTERGDTTSLHPVDRAAEHERDEFDARNVGERSDLHDAPVPQNGHTLADAVDLVHPMADIDDRDALVAQQPNDREEGLDLAGLERRRRFIHDHHTGVDADGAGERDHLLDAEGEAAQRPAHIHFDAVGVEQRSGVGVHAAEVDESDPVSRLTPEEDVLGDGHQRDEVDLLIDRRDPGLLRVERPRESSTGAGEQQVTVIRLVDARQHLDQGRLARAVLAHECHALARADGEVDGIQGRHTRESFGDRPGFENGELIGR